MDNRPVGILDSGLGGLTALAEFKKILPDEDIIFFGDSARAPYGEKTVPEIKACASDILSFFVSSGVKAVLAACGTISVNARDILSSCIVPASNVLEPSVRCLSELSGEAPIGIIATAAAIKSKGYEQALRDIGVKRDIVSVACPDFVPIIEAGLPCSDKRVQTAVENYLKPVKEAGVTALLLGCTHYGIIETAIREYLGDDVTLVSASRCGAEAFSGLLVSGDMCGGKGEIRFYTSGNDEEFRKKGSLILGYDIGEVTSIPTWDSQ